MKESIKFVYLLIFTTIYSCGYLDNGGVVKEISVYKTFKLREISQGDYYQYNLVYNYNSQGSVSLVEDCTEVFYDSINKFILTKKNLNEFSFVYNKITIRNLKETEYWKGYLIYEIKEKKYLSMIKNIKGVNKII